MNGSISITIIFVKHLITLIDLLNNCFLKEILMLLLLYLFIKPSFYSTIDFEY